MIGRLHFLTICSILLLMQVGCSTYGTKEEYAARLSAAIPEKSDIGKIVYTPVSPNEWSKFELGGDSHAFDFGDGKSFFAAFDLVDIDLPASMEVRSAFNTVFQASGHVVLPTILILDSEYSMISGTESQMRQTSAPDGGVEFSHTASVGGDAAFIVVYSNPRTVDRTIPWHFSFYAASPISVGTESNKEAKVGVGGPMRIRIVPRE